METAEKKEKAGVILPTKVTIKHARRNTWLPEKHDGSFRFSRTFERMVPQTDRRTNILNTGLTTADEIRLEQKLRKAHGSLAKTNYEFWSTVFVDIPQAGAVLLPTESVMDEIKYMFLLAHEEVANSKRDFDNGTTPFARYIMHSEEEEVENLNKELNVKLDAYDKFSKMSDTDMKNFLKVYGKNAKDNSPSFIKATIGKVIEQEPQNFLNILKDPNYKMVVFIKTCAQHGFIKEQGGKYMRLGGEVLGYSLEQSVDFLSNPENQEVYLLLKSQLETTK